MTQEASAVATATASGSQPPDEQKSIARFIAVLGEVIGVDSISPGDHFLDVGGDSLSAAILIDWIAQEFGVEPELDWFFDSQTVEELAGKWWGKVQSSGQAVPLAAGQ
jgi:acyl carrier protein